MIKIFWHVCLINHWYSVVAGQMRIILTSGLYDQCSEINIGCTGPEEEFEFLLNKFASLYPKIKVFYFGEKINLYEFPTLGLIQRDPDDFVGLYFHAKGVTKPFDSETNRWREWLNEAIINRWPVHYQNIRDGYDVSSVVLKSNPDHFSGNFWWFNRAYIDKLPPIDKMLWNNRYSAEQWIVRGYHGKFKDEAQDTTQDFHYFKYQPT